jgi:hypothetical protein
MSSRKTLAVAIGQTVAGYRDRDFKRAAGGVVSTLDLVESEWRCGMNDAADMLLSLANAARAPSAFNDGNYSVERAEAYELARDAILRRAAEPSL